MDISPAWIWANYHDLSGPRTQCYWCCFPFSWWLNPHFIVTSCGNGSKPFVQIFCGWTSIYEYLPSILGSLGYQGFDPYPCWFIVMSPFYDVSIPHFMTIKSGYSLVFLIWIPPFTIIKSQFCFLMMLKFTYGGFHKWSYPKMVGSQWFIMENPNLTWMITGGTLW